MLEVLISICQINVALGILYVGLGESRFREKLYAAVETQIKNKDFVNVDINSKAYSSLITGDSEFADFHHLVRDWICELPENRQAGLLSSHWQALTQDDSGEIQSKKRKLPYRYHAFLQNIDKWIVSIVTIIPSFVAIWGLLYLQWSGIAIEQGSGLAIIYLLGLVFGQLVPVGFLVAGLRISRSVRNQLNEAVEYLMTKYSERLASQQLTKA